MKRKIIKWIIILLLLAAVITYFIVLPIIKWNSSYDISDVNTPEKTIEYYFTALSERNPKKALELYPSLNDFGDVNIGVFSLNFIISCEVEKITDVTDLELENASSDEKVLLVDYEIHYLFGIPLNPFGKTSESGKNSLCFSVGKDELTGIWYIKETYPMV